jgi:hypothetical protein
MFTKFTAARASAAAYLVAGQAGAAACERLCCVLHTLRVEVADANRLQPSVQHRRVQASSRHTQTLQYKVTKQLLQVSTDRTEERCVITAAGQAQGGALLSQLSYQAPPFIFRRGCVMN